MWNSTCRGEAALQGVGNANHVGTVFIPGKRYKPGKRELILNSFHAQKLLSSGVVEGLNNRAEVTMRRSYGFRTFRALELALYYHTWKLPEPESTHEFF